MDLANKPDKDYGMSADEGHIYTSRDDFSDDSSSYDDDDSSNNDDDNSSNDDNSAKSDDINYNSSKDDDNDSNDTVSRKRPAKDIIDLSASDKDEFEFYYMTDAEIKI
eukprot:Awhi_evm1s6546